jgi:hypothetical protein
MATRPQASNINKISSRKDLLIIFFAELCRFFWLSGGKFLSKKKKIQIFRQSFLTQNPLIHKGCAHVFFGDFFFGDFIFGNVIFGENY